jgi:sugar diacid utilization regulator
MRRLVTDHTITPVEIRSEARAAGVRLADFYWPALLVWRPGHPGPRTLAELHSEAERQMPQSILVALDTTTVALLVPADGSGLANREDVHRRLACLVRHVRQLGHRDFRAIAGEHSAGLAQLPARVDELERLQRYLPHTATQALVLPPRAFALDCLLSEGLETRRAQAFVHGSLGRLLHYDVDHGTDLAHVLEVALDFPRRDEAARASYMHRNTFRRHLTQARELVDADLEDPDDRLALHVALRLRRLMHGPRATGGSSQRAEGVADPPPPRHAKARAPFLAASGAGPSASPSPRSSERRSIL